MRKNVLLLIGGLAIGISYAAAAQDERAEAVMAKNVIEIPESIRREHEAIHSALVAATRAPGRVGLAAKTLAEVLHPHFVREEEIALPPLGLLAPLAAGETMPEATLSAAAEMASALRAEMPRMLEEHVRIRAAVAELRAAAESAGAEAQVELADELALHAQTEEEVLYPAALLVGDRLRVRRPQH
ncbi:MAG TPA: hemerythrin domain-containing protein [Gammaproteobacteria bacterium]